MSRRTWGRVRKLPSGMHQAGYKHVGRVFYAPTTFSTRDAADRWLAKQRTAIEAGTWVDPDAVAPEAVELDAYCKAWLAQRDLKPRTRQDYGDLLDRHILPTLGGVKIESLTPTLVKAWHATLPAKRPTLRAHAYALLRTILNDAVRDEIIAKNPCTIRGASSAKRVKKIRPATLAELEVITREMPERLQAMVVLASWCAMRFGELAELRRKDIDGDTIHVRRGVVRVRGENGGVEMIVGTPKTDAGVRDIVMPPHVVPVIEAHLEHHTGPGREALLFPAVNGGHIVPSSLYGRAATDDKPGWGFYEARRKAGRDDLRWHDLRHSGAVLAALSGASLAELQGRLGHSTTQAAMRYQHVADGRDRALAQRLSELAQPPG